MKPRIRRVEVTASTNDDVRQAAEAGEAEGFVVHALKQTAGRGRHGRVWESPEGNLYCSVLLRPSCNPKSFGQYSFIAALALADTVHELLPGAPVTLKWPNDVLLDGKKIGGILLESGDGYIIIGMGLNILYHPDNAMYPATSLFKQSTSSQKIFSSSRALSSVALAKAESGEKENLSGTQSAAPQELNFKQSSVGASDWVPDKFASQIFWNDVGVLDKILKSLLDHLSRRYAAMQAEGFAPIRAAWLERAQQGRMTVKLSDQTVEGDFIDIDGEGHLRLRLADGTECALATGDVFYQGR